MRFISAARVSPQKLIAVLLCCCFVMSACGSDEDAKQVDLTKREVLPANTDTPVPPVPLRVAISGMISPKKTYIHYSNIVDYLAGKLELSPLIVQRGSYAEVNNLIRDKKVDLAFVCSGAYVKGRAEFGMELLAAPQVKGQTVYYSYIIVPGDSPKEKFSQLRGGTFAFTDPHSNTGHLVPQNILAQMGETADTFFKQTVFTYNHDRSIISVANGFVDGAAVDSLIWDYMNAARQGYTSRTKIIQKVGPYGIPPVVVHPELDQLKKERLKSLLLGMHRDREGKAILEQLNIDCFVPIEDAAYDNIREIL